MPNNIDLYRIAVMSINELYKDKVDPATTRANLEAMKALIDVLIAKLPKDENTLCDSCLMGGRSSCYHNQPRWQRQTKEDEHAEISEQA